MHLTDFFMHYFRKCQDWCVLLFEFIYLNHFAAQYVFLLLFHYYYSLCKLNLPLPPPSSYSPFHLLFLDINCDLSHLFLNLLITFAHVQFFHLFSSFYDYFFHTVPSNTVSNQNITLSLLFLNIHFINR